MEWHVSSFGMVSPVLRHLVYERKIEKKTNIMKKRIANVIVAVGLVALLSQSASARLVSVPDASSSSLLVGIGLGALAAVKRYLR